MTACPRDLLAIAREPMPRGATTTPGAVRAAQPNQTVPTGLSARPAVGAGDAADGDRHVAAEPFAAHPSPSRAPSPR